MPLPPATQALLGHIEVIEGNVNKFIARGLNFLLGINYWVMSYATEPVKNHTQLIK